MTNYVFAFYALNISYEILKTLWLSNELFSQYAGVANLRADMHHVFIEAHADNKHKWSKLPYVVNKEDAGTQPSIPIPPVTNVDAGPSQMQQNDPLEESEEQSESQENEGDQGGEDGADKEGEESIKTIFDPNRPDKRKSPEAEEVTKPQSRKKTKASKGNNIVEYPTLKSEDLDQALTKSTEFLTKKWSEFATTHQKITELKDLAE